MQGERGRLDVLVNSIAGEDPLMSEWGSFWEVNLGKGEAILRQATLSHVVTAQYAARLMVAARRGLLVEVTENDILMGGSGNVLAQIVKLAHKAPGRDLPPRSCGRTASPRWRSRRGSSRSESMLDHFGVTEANWRGGREEGQQLPRVGVAALRRAGGGRAGRRRERVMKRSGHLFSSWELAREFGFTGCRRDAGRTGGRRRSTFRKCLRRCVRRSSRACASRATWLRVHSERTERYLERWKKDLGAQAARPPDRNPRQRSSRTRRRAIHRPQSTAAPRSRRRTREGVAGVAQRPSRCAQVPPLP